MPDGADDFERPVSGWLATSRWPELEPLLDALLEQPPEDRAAFAVRLAGGDDELLADLNALLRDAGRVTELPLLDSTASGAFASLLREDANAIAETLQVALGPRYVLVKRIGAGGMATVYLVHDVPNDRQVALKVLHPDLTSALGAERFAREARLVATLDHPNIVGIFDSGEADGHLWFTMPFIDGESLGQRIDRIGQIPLDEALAIIREAAEALGFAHARGIIHRDIKPDNILLANGHAFVADFGIARAMEPTDEKLTVTGTSVGTPAYMAPEQAGGERDLDARVDVYALGSVLYEMLAGATAFTGPSAQAIIVRKMTSDPQPIHPIRTAVTPAIDAVILKAMSRTPADRYPTMAEFVEALSVAATTTGTVPPTGRARISRAVLAAGFALAILAVAAIGVLVAPALRGVGAAPPRLAVLPFEDRSRDTTDAYLAEGFTEEIGSRVARVPQLVVLSNTAVRRVSATPSASLEEVGRLLGASFLMSGSVQRIGGRLRVAVELARAETGERVWGESYDRAESELPLLLNDIAVATAEGMLGSLSPDALARLAAPTENSAAYDLYLRGSRTRFDEGATGLQQAIASLEAALVLDPRFASAQGRLAAVYSRTLFWSVSLPGTPTDTVVARASLASARALALDSASSEAWAGRGTVLFFGPNPSYAAAASAMGRAAALDSMNASVHWMRGQILRRLGDFSGAEASTRSAITADGQFRRAYYQLATIAYSTRRLSQALALADSAVALEPTDWQSWGLRSRIEMASNRPAKAIQDAERSVELSPPEQRDYAVMILAQAEAASGDTAAARARLVPVLAKFKRDGALTPRFYQTALAMIAIGQREEGLRTLERIEPRGAWLWSYLITPGFDAVRADPRFVQLVGASRPPGIAP